MRRSEISTVKPDKKTLAWMYWGNGGNREIDTGKTLEQIGSTFGVHRSTVWQWMRDYGIPRRDSKRPRKLPGKSELYDLYVKQGLSTTEIARLYGCEQARSVGKAMQCYGIPRRPRKHVGKSRCIEPGCQKKAHKIKHAGNGSMYGTRCRYHRTLHYAKLSRYLTRKSRKIPAHKWRLEFEIPERVKQGEKFKARKDMECLKQGKKTLLEINRLLKNPALLKSRSAE